MTQTSSLREAINQQSQIFSLNSMSSKTIGLQQAIDQTNQLQMSDSQFKGVLGSKQRLPSAKSKQSAMRAKSKIYSKRNVQEVATTVSSTKNINSRATVHKQMAVSLTRDTGAETSLNNSGMKIQSQNMSSDDYSRRQPAPFMSTQKIIGLSNVQNSGLQLNMGMPNQSTKHISAGAHGFEGQLIPAQIKINNKQAERARKVNRISERDILSKNELAFSRPLEQTSLI